MVLTLGTVDYVVIGLMLSVSAAVGVFFRFTGGKQKTTNEFLMAGRNMGILPVAFSLMATYMSAISVLGIPAEVYLYGTEMSLWICGIPIGSLMAGYLFLPIFYDMNACTAYEYLELRFGKMTRIIASMLFILQMILYMSVVLYAPSLALNAVTGLSTWASVVSLAIVCTFYCSLGGLKAVLWTDVFQALLMYLSISSLVIGVSIKLGGLTNVMQIAQKGGRLIFDEFTPDFTVRYTFWNGLAYGIVFSLSTFGSNQAQIQRLLSVGSLKKAQWALIWSIPMIIVFTTFCSWDGVVIYSLFSDCDPIVGHVNSTLSSADQLVPYAIVTLFGHIPGLSGLCICGIFGASLSTISSAMNSMTAVTIEDFIKPYCFCKKLSETWITFLAKLLAIAYGSFCLLLTFAVASFRGILEASAIFFGVVGGPVLGIFTLGMFTTTANEQGTLIGLLTGMLINAWFGFGSYAANIEIPPLPRGTEGCNATSNETNIIDSTFNAEILTASKMILAEDDNINDDYVLPIYKVSFMWFSVIGCLCTVISGYLSSFLISFCIKRRQVKKSLITPILRKWYFPKDDSARDHNLCELNGYNK